MAVLAVNAERNRHRALDVRAVPSGRRQVALRGSRVRRRGPDCGVERSGVGRQRGTAEEREEQVESVAEGDRRPVGWRGRRCAPRGEASHGCRGEDADAEGEGQRRGKEMCRGAVDCCKEIKQKNL